MTSSIEIKAFQGAGNIRIDMNKRMLEDKWFRIRVFCHDKYACTDIGVDVKEMKKIYAFLGKSLKTKKRK